jgi:hypothetical protein
LHIFWQEATVDGQGKMIGGSDRATWVAVEFVGHPVISLAFSTAVPDFIATRASLEIVGCLAAGMAFPHHD